MNATARSPLTFRAARLDDVRALVALVESAYRGEGSKQGWTTEADLLDGQRTDAEGVADLIVRAGSVVIVADAVGEGLRACAHVEKQGESGYFGMFSVNPRLQGGGLGSALLTEAERIARGEWGCTSMRMTVISVREELIAWYERRDYHRTGEYSPFPYGNDRFGIPKRDDLRFELLVKPLDVVATGRAGRD